MLFSAHQVLMSETLDKLKQANPTTLCTPLLYTGQSIYALCTRLVYRRNVMLEGTTRMYKSDGRHHIYIPAGLVSDSQFPFATEQDLNIQIDGKRLVIEKADKDG